MTGPHQDQPLLTAGTPVAEASGALILVHGRGASARSILEFGRQVHQAGLALLAPQAAESVWYPDSFLAPVETNEPGRSSGLAAIEAAVETVREAGIPRESIVLAGFSQGACLVSEYLARHPEPFGGLAALSGGLLGESIDDADYDGDLAGTPVFLGCSDVDPHIPKARVHETGRVFEAMGGSVDLRIYEGMGHTVNEDERDAVAGLVESVLD